jgi:hypothetical protein
MAFNEFKSILDQLLSASYVAAPLSSKIQISANDCKKNFCLKMTIFKPFGAMPKAVTEYISKRKNHTFKPQATSFLEKDNEIFLIQEIPFQPEGKNSLRQFFVDFSVMAKRCHQMLKEIASEEKHTKLFTLDSHHNQ